METYFEYLREFAPELGTRIVETYPPVQSPCDPCSPQIATLLRQPKAAAQALAITGLAKSLRTARSAMIIGECGSGKTYMALGAIHAHAAGRPYTVLAMVPPHIVHKWAREVMQTVPRARVFIIEDLRNGGDPQKPHGIVEVKADGKHTKIHGLKATLPELRRMGRKGWAQICPQPAFFVMGKEKAKLGYFWRHAPVYRETLGGLEITNPETGGTIDMAGGGVVCQMDLKDAKIGEWHTRPKGGTRVYSPLWQADGSKIRRTAPLDYIGRFMKGWWNYSIADELHQLAGDTAQGNGLGVLYRCSRKLLALTGTLMGGYADDLFNILFRMGPAAMVSAGFSADGGGRRDFQQQYGVLETVETVRPTDNACTRAPRRTVRTVRKPGASPLLFGNFLMGSTAFINLEDISDALPPYEETLLTVKMDEPLEKAYRDTEQAIRRSLESHRGNKSLMSVLLNTLLLYPDHPYGFGPIYGKTFDPAIGRMVPFLVAEPAELTLNHLYAKEARLIEDIRAELAQGRRCQVYATYTGERDVTARLEQVLREAGFRVAVLRSSVPTDKRELWYEKRLAEGVEVVVCHPKLVETGLDLLSFPTLYFYETGYWLHTLRQASRRSWRIGQTEPVRVKFMAYERTMQETCIRLMGKKMLVALMMEGKMSGEGLGSLDADEDMMSAMARELVQKGRVGESADAVWRDMERERAKHLTVPPRPMPAPLPVPFPISATMVAGRLETESPWHGLGLLDFSAPAAETLSAVLGLCADPYTPTPKRKRVAALPETQLLLFA